MAPRKRRESSAESGLRSTRTRRDSNTAEFVKHWNRRESTVDEPTTVAVNVVVEPTKSVSFLVFVKCRKRFVNISLFLYINVSFFSLYITFYFVYINHALYVFVPSKTPPTINQNNRDLVAIRVKVIILVVVIVQLVVL